MPRPDPRPPAPGGRRPPPPFRLVTIIRTELLTPRLGRVTLGGPELDGLIVEEPAASVRVMLPTLDGGELVIPDWAGNEFLLPDGRRPTIRTLTPRRVDRQQLELEVEVVIHGTGAAAGWAGSARPGSPAAVSGPARGYTIDEEAPGFFLAGDETAIPAISQLLERLPAHRRVDAEIEVADPDARFELPVHPGASVHWRVRAPGTAPGDALVAAVRAAHFPPNTRAWVAGEAAAVQRIRRLFFEERGLPRAHATVRGYWKHGRRGDAGGD
jgi:NADPH-dependent ferric siderophore reductase